VRRLWFVHLIELKTNIRPINPSALNTVVPDVLLRAIKEGEVMKTAERVRYLGLYASACCVDEIVFDVNDQFSRCPKCDRLCGWNFVERVFSWRELEDLETLAA
jgi:hypothetical protein